MSLRLIKEAVTDSKYSPNKKKTISILEQAMGKTIARSIVESYQVTPDDYTKWLEVIKGYAADNGINIRTKVTFIDTAFAVLENDPAPLSSDMQEAIVNTLWAHFKAAQQHSRVERAGRAQEEEEQLEYALKKMKGYSEENEESGFAQIFKASKGVENEEYGDMPDEFDPREMEDDGERDASWRNDHQSPRDDWFKTQDADQNDLPFDDDEMEDERITSRGNEMSKSRDLEDFDSVSSPRRKFKPKSYYASEQEESSKFASPFSKGQLVTCKKDGASYKVAIPNGPGDMVGIMVNNRIKMVPLKDLDTIHTSEEEESTSKTVSKTSFLHDILNGENSRQHLAALQKEIEDTAANAWTTHHAKLPTNPHPKGSLAHKSWQKGIEQAAKAVWAPKPAIDPNSAKAKLNKKKK